MIKINLSPKFINNKNKIIQRKISQINNLNKLKIKMKTIKRKKTNKKLLRHLLKNKNKQTVMMNKQEMKHKSNHQDQKFSIEFMEIFILMKSTSFYCRCVHPIK